MIAKIISCQFIAQRSIQQSSAPEPAFSAVVWFTYSASSWPVVRYSYNDTQRVSILRKFMWCKMSNFLKPREGYYIAFIHTKENSTKVVLLLLIAGEKTYPLISKEITRERFINKGNTTIKRVCMSWGTAASGALAVQAWSLDSRTTWG